MSIRQDGARNIRAAHTRSVALFWAMMAAPGALFNNIMHSVSAFDRAVAKLEAWGAENLLPQHAAKLSGDDRAQASTVITTVVIGVVAMVGILIVSQTYEAMPAMDSTNPLNGSVDSTVEGFGSAIEFVPIILLVLLASVVIMVVQRMRA